MEEQRVDDIGNDAAQGELQRSISPDPDQTEWIVKDIIIMGTFLQSKSAYSCPTEASDYNPTSLTYMYINNS
jgi:hypothetical protein